MYFQSIYQPWNFFKFLIVLMFAQIFTAAAHIMAFMPKKQNTQRNELVMKKTHSFNPWNPANGAPNPSTPCIKQTYEIGKTTFAEFSTERPLNSGRAMTSNRVTPEAIP